MFNIHIMLKALNLAIIWRSEDKSWNCGIVSDARIYQIVIFFSLIKHWNLLHLIKISEGNRLVTPDLSETYVPENRYIVRHITTNDPSIVVLIPPISTSQMLESHHPQLAITQVTNARWNPVNSDVSDG